MHHEAIFYAQLIWDASGAPRSATYGDIYFSLEDGVAETEHVFLSGNKLAERFVGLEDSSHFVIGETGFGSGLNFFCAAARFLETAPPGARLYFVSVEKNPFHPTDLLRAAAGLPDTMQSLAKELIGQYPPLLGGLHRLVLAEGRIHLNLFLGEAEAGLQGMCFAADAWFLDGFAPGLNPDIWTEKLLQTIAAKSHSRTTLATFTSAGEVRRTLEKTGFKVLRTKGYGRKRHMIVAHRDRDTIDSPHENATHSPSIQQAADTLQKKRKKVHVVVVGSGLSGACTAFQLRRTGHKVTVLEAADNIAAGGSGNPQGALYIKPGVEWSTHTRLHIAAYQYACRFYANIAGLPPTVWNQSGLLAQASNPKESARQDKLLELNHYPEAFVRSLSGQAASLSSRINLTTGGLWFQDGGWLKPQAACVALLENSGVQVNCGSTVRKVRQDTLTNRLLVETDEDSILCEHLVLATAQWPDIVFDVELGVPQLPLKPISGQVSLFRPSPALAPLACVICGDGYVIPCDNDLQLTGATFHVNRNDSAACAEDDRKNLQKLALLVAIKRQDIESITIAANRVAVRYSLPDYMPVAGRLDNKFPTTSATAASVCTKLSTPSLWFIGGLGSKGIALAPLLSQAICDAITDAPAPLEYDIIDRLCPHRFTTRKAK
jgi:tRNA 5-methylaminomethyl-2-thiouridine biosynthesis bifunctional protein